MRRPTSQSTGSSGAHDTHRVADRDLAGHRDISPETEDHLASDNPVGRQ